MLILLLMKLVSENRDAHKGDTDNPRFNSHFCRFDLDKHVLAYRYTYCVMHNKDFRLAVILHWKFIV